MINHLPEIEITDNTNPFEHDRLDRQSVSNILTSVVSLYGASGCVMSLNGEWGTGKTTFVKMWKQSLENEGFKALYFNAWEHDFIDDPLIALISEMSDQLKIEKDSFKELVSIGSKIITNSGLNAIKSLIATVCGSTEIVNSIIDTAQVHANKSLDEYVQKKNSVIDFKKKLAQFVTENTLDIEKPIVFFIDELDRCNPHYAVKTLERVKHLFEVPNIVFVMVMNKKQLEYSVKGYYGNSDMDANAYLRRFIDIEYSLPTPETSRCIEYLSEIYELKRFFLILRSSNQQFTNDEYGMLIKMMEILFESSKISLRSMDKILAHCRLALQTYGSDKLIHPEILILLCYFRLVDITFYNNIKFHKYSINEILDALEERLPKELTTASEYSYSLNLPYIIAEFLVSYNYDSHGREIEKDNNLLSEEAKKHGGVDRERINEIVSENTYTRFNTVPMPFIFNHIDLTCDIVNSNS